MDDGRAMAEGRRDRREALEVFAPYVMNRIMARYNRRVEEALRPEGISVPQMRVLAALSDAGPLTVNELSVLTVIKQSTLSRTLDMMEGAGFLRREADQADSRIRTIHLTAAGDALHRRAWPAMERAEEHLLSALGPAEREVFRAMLVCILHATRHHAF